MAVATRIALVLTIGSGLALSACIDPSARIASGLEGYGFSSQQSECVGNRLEANLSLGQLQQLGRAAKAARENDTTPGALTTSDFVRAAGQVKDPKVAIEVAKAATGCGIVAIDVAPVAAPMPSPTPM